MKINEKIISLPPFISTSWSSISSLQMNEEKTELEIEMKNGKQVTIPGLSSDIIEKIFDAHALYLEKAESQEKNEAPKVEDIQGQLFDALGTAIGQLKSNPLLSGFSFKLPLDMSNLDKLGGLLQHNQEQADSPPIPSEILSKVIAITRSVSSEQSIEVPEAVENCNCPHCQISRAIQEGVDVNEERISEEISEDDLRFKEWDIFDSGDKIYLVSNPFDKSEVYRVFLGEPLGCTCGAKNCEHIAAVLKS